MLKEGQEVEVTILEIQEEGHRVSLCVGEPRVQGEKAAALSPAEAVEAAKAAAVGETLEGEVEKQAPYGLFVRLPNGQTGLLHISQLALEVGENALRERVMFRRHPLHSKIQVLVKEVNGDRVSLTTPEMAARETESMGKMEVRDAGNEKFGSLGDLFSGLKL